MKPEEETDGCGSGDSSSSSSDSPDSSSSDDSDGKGKKKHHGKHGKHHRGRKHRKHRKHGKHHGPWKWKVHKWKKWMHSHKDMMRHFMRKEAVHGAEFPSWDREYCEKQIAGCNELPEETRGTCNLMVELQYKGQTGKVKVIDELIKGVCRGWDHSPDLCRCTQLMRYSSRNPLYKSNLATCLETPEILKDKEIMLGRNFR